MKTEPVERMTYTYHGTMWRCLSYWKDTGVEDGVMWKCDIEWLDGCGNWHTEESWDEEKGRRIPNSVIKWHEACNRELCPRIKMDHVKAICSLCKQNHTNERI